MPVVSCLWFVVSLQELGQKAIKLGSQEAGMLGMF